MPLSLGDDDFGGVEPTKRFRGGNDDLRMSVDVCVPQRCLHQIGFEKYAPAANLSPSDSKSCQSFENQRGKVDVIPVCPTDEHVAAQTALVARPLPQACGDRSAEQHGAAHAEHFAPG